MQGIVKFFSSEKGWGFILGQDGIERFFHYSSIQKEGYKSILADQKVSFEEGQNDKGACAVNVKIINE